VTNPCAILLVGLAGAWGSGCEASNEPVDGGSRRDGPVASAGRIVDSARTLDEDLRRFRADIPAAPVRFSGGAPSREALVRNFLNALAKSDTAALASMALTRAEFAYLTYPSSPYTRAPYRQSPEIVWLLLRAEHEKGLTRLLRRLGGAKVDYLGHRCDPEPLREGENRLWRGCRVRVRIGGDTARDRRLFGVIFERDGEFKFASYRTDF
jgi:hypothetical protein